VCPIKNVATLTAPAAPSDVSDSNKDSTSGATGSQQRQSGSSEQHQRSSTIDRDSRYKLVGSRLYPAVSEISLFDNNELLAEAVAEAAAAAGSANGSGSGPGPVRLMTCS